MRMRLLAIGFGQRKVQENIPEIQFEEDFSSQDFAIVLTHPSTDCSFLLSDLEVPLVRHLDLAIRCRHDNRYINVTIKPGISSLRKAALGKRSGEEE